MAHDVFISHSSHDKVVADATCAALESAGVRCWIAPRDVLAGTEWGESIVNAIEGCRAMVLIFSGNANDSRQVRKEVERAVSKGKIIISFRIADILPSKSMELFLSDTHWLDALTPPLELRISELVATVSQLFGNRTRKARAPATSSKADATGKAVAANAKGPASENASALKDMTGSKQFSEWFERLNRRPAKHVGEEWEGLLTIGLIGVPDGADTKQIAAHGLGAGDTIRCGIQVGAGGLTSNQCFADGDAADVIELLGEGSLVRGKLRCLGSMKVYLRIDDWLDDADRSVRWETGWHLVHAAIPDHSIGLGTSSIVDDQGVMGHQAATGPISGHLSATDVKTLLELGLIVASPKGGPAPSSQFWQYLRKRSRDFSLEFDGETIVHACAAVMAAQGSKIRSPVDGAKLAELLARFVPFVLGELTGIAKQCGLMNFEQDAVRLDQGLVDEVIHSVATHGTNALLEGEAAMNLLVRTEVAAQVKAMIMLSSPEDLDLVDVLASYVFSIFRTSEAHASLLRIVMSPLPGRDGLIASEPAGRVGGELTEQVGIESTKADIQDNSRFCDWFKAASRRPAKHEGESADGWMRIQSLTPAQATVVDQLPGKPLVPGDTFLCSALVGGCNARSSFCFLDGDLAERLEALQPDEPVFLRVTCLGLIRVWDALRYEGSDDAGFRHVVAWQVRSDTEGQAGVDEVPSVTSSHQGRKVFDDGTVDETGDPATLCQRDAYGAKTSRERVQAIKRVRMYCGESVIPWLQAYVHRCKDRSARREALYQILAIGGEEATAAIHEIAECHRSEWVRLEAAEVSPTADQLTTTGWYRLMLSDKREHARRFRLMRGVAQVASSGSIDLYSETVSPTIELFRELSEQEDHPDVRHYLVAVVAHIRRDEAWARAWVMGMALRAENQYYQTRGYALGLSVWKDDKSFADALERCPEDSTGTSGHTFLTLAGSDWNAYRFYMGGWGDGKTGRAAPFRLPVGVQAPGSPQFNAPDGAELVWIPSGEFTMGDEDQPENPKHRVHLAGFWIYKCPVTVAMYRRFSEATGRPMPEPPAFDPKWAAPDHPIVNVTWDDAFAYSAWANCALPSDEQWEKAARGTDGRKFPWGNEYDQSKAWVSLRDGDARGTTKVGKFGISPYGCSDMAGNASEWCSDRDHCSTRGGGWFWADPVMLRSSYIYHGLPEDCSDGLGFRCVRVE